MILVDANIFMYAAGAAHPHKEPCVQLLNAIAQGQIEAVTNTEVLQEILHRYRAINRWEQGKSVYDYARQIVPHVIAVTVDIMDLTRTLLDRYPQTMARDALHSAVYKHAHCKLLCSYDRDFDTISEVTRAEPPALLSHL